MTGTAGGRSPRLGLPVLTSSSSSLSSTFSDISFSSFSAPSPPPSSASRTNTFFASPFSTRSHSPEPPSTASPPPKPRVNKPSLDIPHSHSTFLFSSPCNEPTPRPTNLVPALLFTNADIDSPEQSPMFSPTIESSGNSLENPSPISPPPPLSSSASTSSTTSDASCWTQTFIAGQNTDTTLKLFHPLGQGAFSSVWLAEDLSPVSLTLKAKRRLRDLREPTVEDRSQLLFHASSDPPMSGALGDMSRNASLKRLRERVRGTKPSRGNIRLQDGTYLVDERDGEMGVITAEIRDSSEIDDSFDMNLKELGLGASLARVGSLSGKVTSVASNKQRPCSDNVKESTRRLVAVKLTPRGANDQREAEKERVAFVREVEVLRHISHPNIAPLLSHLSTPTHYVLVFPYLPGGDLLSLVNSDIIWHKLGEDVLKRIWCEICKAVGWMHGVGLVHRDIKLENILLTTCAFCTLMPDSARPTLDDLPAPPAPIIRLSDFGLSRFVELFPNGEAELLSTRCGSEAYAAPELVTAGGRSRLTNTSSEGDPNKPKNVGVYDARETDAWACGVVLYALAARRLPFGEDIVADGISHERRSFSKSERKRFLMRIAKGEYSWPELDSTENHGTDSIGASLATSRGVKRIVGKLLVRDPAKRARIADLWSDPWMKGTGIGKDLPCTLTSASAEHDFVDLVGSLELQQGAVPLTDTSKVDEKTHWLEEEELQQLEQQEEQHGAWLVDEHAIHTITRQELA